jgi:hypothetical protein
VPGHNSRGTKALRGGELVNVRGLLYGGEVLYLADKDLNGCGDSVIGIEIPVDGKIASESEVLIRKLRRLSGKEGVARAEFEVIGTMAGDASNNGAPDAPRRALVLNLECGRG